MEETKYYTPEITEFHIGFEYESEEPNGTYTQLIFNIKSSLEFIDDHLSEFRVKYLDKEDIESFGFEQIDCSFSKEWLSFLIKDDEDSTKRLILDMNRTKVQIGNCGTYEDHRFRFDGIIKNKSELSFILKRLQIINE